MQRLKILLLYVLVMLKENALNLANLVVTTCKVNYKQNSNIFKIAKANIFLRAHTQLYFPLLKI